LIAPTSELRAILESPSADRHGGWPIDN